MSNVWQESNDNILLISQLNVHTAAIILNDSMNRKQLHKHMAPQSLLSPQSLPSWHGDLIKVECAGWFIAGEGGVQSLLSDLRVLTAFH